MEQILYRLSRAIRSAICGTDAQRKFIPYVLRNLIELETRPVCLTEIAYDWCSMIYENRQSLRDWKSLLLTCLEIGFRRLDPQDLFTPRTLAHPEHHAEMVDTVFGSQDSEAIADLLHAWNIGRSPYISFGTCTERLVCLHNIVPFSPRLRELVIRSVDAIGYGGFEKVGVARFVELLDYLRVPTKDAMWLDRWSIILLDTLRTPEGIQLLSHWYWESLVELVIILSPDVTYDPQIMASLVEAQEWSKLECWIGTVWIVWPPEADGITEEDLGRSTILLFRQRPGAFRKLEQWMEKWSRVHDKNIPEAFRRICEQALEAAQRDTP